MLSVVSILPTVFNFESDAILNDFVLGKYIEIQEMKKRQEEEEQRRKEEEERKKEEEERRKLESLEEDESIAIQLNRDSRKSD